MNPINILHIVDNEDDATLVKLILNDAKLSFKQTVISRRESLLKALDEGLPDIVLSDHFLPAFNSLEALNIVKYKNKNLPFILITGNTSEEFAAGAINAGADDYIFKDRMQRLPMVLLKALEKYELTMSGSNFQSDTAEEILESEEKYRSFFENSMDGMLITVTDGHILAANPAACAMFQKTENEILAGGRFALVDLTDPNLISLIKERQKWGRSQGEVTFIRKDGSKFPGEITSAVFNSAYGQQRTSMIIRDISLRKETEQKLIATSNALRETLNFHNNIMNSSLDVICSVDQDGKFLNVSAACEQIWGYTPLELVGHRYMELVFAEDIEKSVKSATSVMDGIAATTFENRYIHKDGSIVQMLWSANWDEKDKIIYCVGKNITDKKRLEKALEVERQGFYDLYLQAPSCMGVLKGPEHVFEMANPLYLQLVGKKDIIGKKAREAFPEMIAQGLFDILDTVYRTGETFFANEMLIKFDFDGTGKLVDRYLNFIYQAHRNGDGNIDGIFFFVIDVTEQVLAHQKIEASEKMFRQIVETAQEGIWMLDETNKTVFVNSKMCEILEYSEEEMMGKPNTFFKEDEDQKLGLQDIERRKKGIRETFESNFITKSGRKICAQISTNALLDGEGNYRGALAMVTDITEKKEMQNQLLNEQIDRQKQITRATLQAQESERNYLGGELHDNINQILAAVKLQLGYCLGRPENEKGMLERAYKNVESTMDEIRILSHRLVTHRFREEPFLAMVNNLIMELFAPDTVILNADDFNEEIPNEIKLTMYRIIQEHLNNILKHARANLVILSICNNKDAMSVTIEDDGIGFDVNHNSNGIGLSNIHNRAESYNGTVGFITQPGKGCKLKVVIPY